MLLCKCLDLEYDLETKDCKPVTARQCISGSIKHDSSLINRLNGGCHGNWAEKKPPSLGGLKHTLVTLIVTFIYINQTKLVCIISMYQCLKSCSRHHACCSMLMFCQILKCTCRFMWHFKSKLLVLDSEPRCQKKSEFLFI